MTAIYQVVTALHDAAGNYSSNVFHYELAETGGFNSFEYADKLIDKWRLGPQPAYQDLIGSDVILDYITAKKVTGGGGPSAVQIVASLCTGSATSRSSGLCADVAWQCDAQTNRPSHSYIPSIPGDSLDGGFFIPAYDVKVDSFATAMMTVLALAGGAGNANFGQYAKKLNQFTPAFNGKLKPKPTMLNKRTVPLI